MYVHLLWLAASPAAGEPVRAGTAADPTSAGPRSTLTPRDLVWPAPAGGAEVVGGTPVPQGRWDDAVGIVFDGSWVGCTGTLIGPQVVLTAGHCVVGLDVTHVIVGSKNSATDQGEVIAVDEVHEYPDSQRTRDLALLTLRTPSSYPPRAVGIECIVEEYLHDGAAAQIVGFGATTERGTDYNTRLNEAETVVVDADCDERRVNGILSGCMSSVSPGGELAAGGGGIDACFGDSGGPLYLLTDRGDYVVGVTSRALAGASWNFPCRDGGIWVRPDAAIDWIEQRAGGLEILYPSCNEPPEVEADDIVTEMDQPGTTRVTVRDPDGPNDEATVRVVERPADGKVRVEGADLVYTPDPGFLGNDRFTVEVTDAGVAGMPRTGGPVSVEAEIGVVVWPAEGTDPTGGLPGTGDGDDPAEPEAGGYGTAYVQGCTCRTGAGAGGHGLALVGLTALLAARRRSRTRR